jgi:hypothetical protein
MHPDVQKHITDTLNQKFKNEGEYKQIKNILETPVDLRTKEDIFSLTRVFGRNKFFKGKEDLLPDLVNIMKFESISQFKNVMKFGEIGDKFYIIVKGLVSIKIPNPSIKDWKQEHKHYKSLLEWKNKHLEPMIDDAIKRKYEGLKDNMMKMDMDVKSPQRETPSGPKSGYKSSIYNSLDPSDGNKYTGKTTEKVTFNFNE